VSVGSAIRRTWLRVRARRELLETRIKTGVLRCAAFWCSVLPNGQAGF
jgi:hypothetical protein